MNASYFINPVSYTHLGTKFTSTSIVDFTVKDKVADQKDLLWANATNKTNGTVTVSYTHLDVYKRQLF